MTRELKLFADQLRFEAARYRALAKARVYYDIDHCQKLVQELVVEARTANWQLVRIRKELYGRIL